MKEAPVEETPDPTTVMLDPSGSLFHNRYPFPRPNLEDGRGNKETIV